MDCTLCLPSLQSPSAWEGNTLEERELQDGARAELLLENSEFKLFFLHVSGLDYFFVLVWFFVAVVVVLLSS